MGFSLWNARFYIEIQRAKISNWKSFMEMLNKLELFHVDNRFNLLAFVYNFSHHFLDMRDSCCAWNLIAIYLPITDFRLDCQMAKCQFQRFCWKNFLYTQITFAFLRFSLYIYLHQTIIVINDSLQKILKTDNIIFFLLKDNFKKN